MLHTLSVFGMAKYNPYSVADEGAFRSFCIPHVTTMSLSIHVNLGISEDVGEQSYCIKKRDNDVRVLFASYLYLLILPHIILMLSEGGLSPHLFKQFLLRNTIIPLRM